MLDKDAQHLTPRVSLVRFLRKFSEIAFKLVQKHSRIMANMHSGDPDGAVVGSDGRLDSPKVESVLSGVIPHGGMLRGYV
jgi:hypothetical protein